MSLHPIFEKILGDAQAIPAKVAAATVEKPRCARHAWREQPLGEPYPDHATYRHCTRCGIDFDEIEAELADEKARADGLNDELNAETERRERAETAAKLNADTIAMQQQAIHELEAAHAKELASVRADLNRFRTERNELKAITRDMQDLIVETRDAGAASLWTLYEQSDVLTRPRCTVCRDVACAPVCPENENVLRYEREADQR